MRPTAPPRFGGTLTGMGATRRIRQGRRGVLAAGLVVVAAGSVVACDPTAGLNSATVAYTTDQVVTRELERRHTGVRWMTCNASYDEGASPSAGERTVARVDCEGQTDDGEDITVDGHVTRVVEGACVRGELTAKVDGRQRFRVSGLGNCDATPTPPVSDPSRTGPRPTVTVTVTRTVYCQGRPDCWPEGK
ncbi:lipoprotein [Streptomyces griseoviridis]|uniref:Lipoprotein n=2 Tax=Streptomyces griseoviridis TaxID=45398 RepID=A0A918L856_STRGD|nr:lipoprotein [Streptomyces niveoruber]